MKECEEKWSLSNSDFLSLEYLTVLEKSNPSDLVFRYLVITNSKNEVCGLVYFQLLNFSGKNVHLKTNVFLKSLVSLFLKICTFRILICGNVFAVNFRPFIFNEKMISEEMIFKIVEQYTRMEKNDAVLLKDFGENRSNAVLYSSGFQNYHSDLTMCLDITSDWNSINDYKNSLTKKYRKRFEKIRHSGTELQRVELSFEQIVANRENLYRLFKQVSAKQSIAMGLIDKNYFEEFKRAFPEKFTVVGYFLKNKLVAFCTYIDRDPLLEVHYIGMDYEINNTYQLYFNILFDSTERAIDKKMEELELGRTAREAKANLGCRAVYFNDYVKLNSKMAIKASEWLGTNFQRSMGQDWQKRSPFRKSIP